MFANIIKRIFQTEYERLKEIAVDLYDDPVERRQWIAENLKNTSSSNIRSVLVYMFVPSYFLLLAMIIAVLSSSLEITDLSLTFISTAFGGLNTKVGTVIDYFFGASSNNNEN